MLPTSFDDGLGVGTVEDEDSSQVQLTRGEAQVGVTPPASRDFVVNESTVKTEELGAESGEKSAAVLQEQLEGTGQVQSAVLSGTLYTDTSISASQAHKHSNTDLEPKPTKKPRLSALSDGLIEPDLASTSIENGKLSLHSRKSSYVTENNNFPMKLYDMLSNPDNHHAISWMPHGRAWKVRQKDLFMRTICPKYFSQTKFESFIRQANGWGFRRIRQEGPDRNAYYHELFLRGEPDLIKDIKRPLPGEKASKEVTEPNFYNMPAMPSSSHEDFQSFKQVSFASPTNYERSKKKKKEKQKQSSPERSSSDPYKGYASYDPQWGGMPPPPSWGDPYAFSQMPPPPPPLESGMHPPSSPSRQSQETNMSPSPSKGIPPFDPSHYFPPYYTPYLPPPLPPMHQTSSQDNADGSPNNDNFKMNLPPDAQTLPPPQFSYPPYPHPPPYQYPPGNYYPPPGDMPYVPSPDGAPTYSNSTYPESYNYHYQIGSAPPNPTSFPEGNSDDPKVQRNGPFHFSPFQNPEES